MVSFSSTLKVSINGEGRNVEKCNVNTHGRNVEKSNDNNEKRIVEKRNDSNERIMEKCKNSDDRYVEKCNNKDKNLEKSNVNSEDRNVEKSNDDLQNDNHDVSYLQRLEGNVVKKRSSLSTGLFKLSAYMSQLRKETAGVESGLKYVEELKQQLRETEDLVSSRQAKVDHLRDVIRESHQQIIEERKEMTTFEEQCRNVGVKVIGELYKPPSQGADNIRRKLEQIKSTALSVQTSGNTGTESGKSMLQPGLASKEQSVENSSDYVSPLEHMNSDSNGLDPNTQLCQFQLAGKCLDNQCPFQHCS